MKQNDVGTFLPVGEDFMTKKTCIRDENFKRSQHWERHT